MQYTVPDHFTPERFNREWRTGDRVEVELPLKMRLEAVDRQHPDTVALLTGPLVLMPVSHQPQPQLRRATLLAAKRAAGIARAWTAGSDGAALTLKAFMDIQDEQYTTYLRVLSA
jgi:uncharacterized protein